MAQAPGDGVFVRRNFLAPLDLLRVLGALERLSASWAPSQALGLLGRGQTNQVRATNIAAQAALDEVRALLATATLRQAQACGFAFAAPPHLQLFPVRMIGDRARPAFQEPHTDSAADRPEPPTCTSVFYVSARDIAGGELAVAPRDPRGSPLILRPVANTLVSFSGDRVHWVQPLYAGERVSVVVNLY